MSLKPKTTTKINLKKALIYTLLGGSALGIVAYIGLTFFGVITPKKMLAAQVTGYSWDAVITIDNSKVSGSSNLIDFPVAVVINNSALKSVANGGKVEDSNGFDIVFSDMNNDQLDHQMESYNPATGEYVAWVKIPSLSPTVNTSFKMFYGNSTVTADLSTENVWNTDYEGVWHMNNDPSNSDLDDGAGNYDAQDYGSMDSNDLIVGKIGPAIDFDGNNDRYAIKNKKYNTSGAIAKLTVSGWFKTTYNDNYWAGNWAMLDFDRSEYFNVFVHGRGKIGFSTRASIGGIDDFYVGNNGEYNDGNWHYVVATYDGANKCLFVDGVLEGIKNNPHTGNPLGKGNVTRYGFIGDGSEASTFNGNRNNIHYKGQYDELRMLEVCLSPEWIATEYENQNSPSTFYTIEFGSSPLPVELIDFNVELIDNSVEVTWSTATEINNDFFTVEKSSDAVNYDVLDEVAGAGNSSTVQNYSYIDDNVFDGVSYYRLKQTDFDGKFEYFAPQSINSQSSSGSLTLTNVKPNPFKGQFILEIESEKSGVVDFLITSMNGSKVHSSQIELNKGRNEYTYSKGSGLTPGTYIISIVQDGVPLTYKVIKK